jgi:hypothetical protein
VLSNRRPPPGTTRLTFLVETCHPVLIAVRTGVRPVGPVEEVFLRVPGLTRLLSAGTDESTTKVPFPFLSTSSMTANFLPD